MTIKQIASRSNPWFKQLRKMARPGGTREGWIWLEGIHLCEEYLGRVGLPEYAVFDAARVDADELAALRSALPAELCIALETGLLDQVSEVAAAQGVGFLAPLPQPALPARIIEDCVVLDNVQDPGNVGSLMRTCAAAGIRQLVLTPGCAGVWSGKVLRAAQGAHFALDIYEHVATDSLLERLAVPIVVTTLADAEDLYQTALPQPAAWVFGHEGQGVGAALLARAACRIRIPQAAGVESLNVAAAAAVCLFEQRRRRLAGAA